MTFDTLSTLYTLVHTQKSCEVHDFHGSSLHMANVMETW